MYETYQTTIVNFSKATCNPNHNFKNYTVLFCYDVGYLNVDTN